MVRIRLDKVEDFGRECKNLGIQRLYLSLEQKAVEFEKQMPAPAKALAYLHITSVITVMAVDPNGTTLIVHPHIADVRDVAKDEITEKYAEDMNEQIQDAFVSWLGERMPQPFEFRFGVISLD
jgi:hypothetical protein